MSSAVSTPVTRGRRHLALAVIAAAALLTGCSTTPAPSPSESVTSPAPSEKPAEKTSYPLTLDTEHGSSTLAAAPERVVALGDIDDALALGVIPVGSFRPAGDATDLYDYEQTALDKALADGATTKIEKLFDPYAEPDYEAIAKLKPDVILASGYWDLAKSYAKLARIAPVVALPKGTESTWETRHRIVAKSLDRATRGEENINKVHAAFDAARTANPAFSTLTLNYAVVYPTQVTYMSVPDTEASWFFTQLGFAPGASHATFGPEYPADVVSEEQTPLLEADIVVIGYHTLLEPGQREKFEESPLFTALNAVKEKRYIALPEGHDSSIPQPGVLSSLDDLDAVLPLLESVTKEK